MKLRRFFPAITLALAPIAAAQPLDFGDVEYRKLDTRERTEQWMTNALNHLPELEWGPWYILMPFEGNDDKGQIGRVLPLEEELASMGAGGPGPDLTRSFVGKEGESISWQPIGSFENRKIDLKVHPRTSMNIEGIGYLYRAVRTDSAATLRVTMGSDDGLRFWLNGKLLIDADVERGLDPEEHKLELALEPGVNHLLCKVSQGAGGWDYQLNTQRELDPYQDAMLQAALNRDFPTREQAYYTAETIPVPPDVVLEVGGLAAMPDGRVAVCSRRGDVYLVDYTGVKGGSIFRPHYARFASGLHEALGLAAREENGRVVLYTVQRGELTRLVDENGDDRADLYETFCDAWGVSGNYHEFAFGPKFDAQGNAWVSLNVGFCGSLGKSIVPYRGWILKVTPDAELVPVCDGVRSPNGMGFLPTGEMFYVDNQGDYVGTNRMNLVAHDLWQGHPSSVHWREGLEGFTLNPPRQPATLWFPYKKMGQSVADITIDDTAGRFGPFAGQIFVGDQMNATVMRASLEQVDGFWQGACFILREGLDCGLNRIVFDREGSMIVGQTDRGWGSIGRRRFGIQRIKWTGKTPFEVHTMHATPDGFRIGFTRDVDQATAADAAGYRMLSYTYEYHKTYGSDEMETRELQVREAIVEGPRTVRLVVGGLRSGGEGYVHELHADVIRAADGEPLLHAEAYYTMQRLPGSDG